MRSSNDKQRFLEELRKTPVVQVACQKAGIGRTTYYRWRKEDKEFAVHADEALSEGRVVVNELGEAQTISLMKDRNMHAIRFWLTHNDPRYSNKLEITGNLLHSTDELSPEQAELLKKAVKLAIPTNDYEPRNTGADDSGEELQDSSR